MGNVCFRPSRSHVSQEFSQSEFSTASPVRTSERPSDASLDAGLESSSACHRSGLRGPAKHSMLSLDEIGLVGAARWPDDAPGLNISNKSNTQENKRYCESLYQAARIAGGSIASGRVTSFDGLWRNATKWRLSRILSGDASKIDFATVHV